LNEMQVSYTFDGVEIYGHIDALDEKGSLYELKTVNWLPREPYQHHIGQLNCYYTLLKRNGFTVAEAHVLYPSMKGLKNFRIESPTEIDNWLTDRARTLQDAISKDYIPSPMIERRDEWRCKYCVFTFLCIDRNVNAYPSIAKDLSPSQTKPLSRGKIFGLRI